MSGSAATSCSSKPGGRWIFARSSAGLSFGVFATVGGSGSAAMNNGNAIVRVIATRARRIGGSAGRRLNGGGFQTLDHLRMNPTVGGDLVGGEAVFRAAVEARHHAARLTDQYEAAGHIPGVIVERPVTVKAAACQIREV